MRPMIHDICPGAFADPAPLSAAERDAVRARWESRFPAAGRDAWAVVGLGVVFDNLERERKDRALDFLRRAPSSMARWAADMVDAGKATITAPDPDAFTFTISPGGPDCGTCKGTGEIVEFPADEDERLVACPRCGGTGEGIRS